jgi:DNA-binding beta-propeller fold protein YncE/uncharacterized RDD family membrane protein YckC
MTEQPQSPPSGYPPPAPGEARRRWREAHPQTAYTSWIRRRCASIIDFTLLFIVAMACGLTGAAIEGVSCPTDSNTGGVSCSPWVDSMFWPILGLVVQAYWIWNWGYRQGTNGSSIGKSVLGFKVVSEQTGQPIGFGRSVVRQIAHLLDVVSLIGFDLPLVTVKKQTIADMIMGTVCVPIDSPSAPPQQSPPPAPPWSLAEQPFQATPARSRTPWIIAGVAAVIVAIIGVGIVATARHDTSQTSPQSRQTVLPFTGLNTPDDVAVDSVGNVYLADFRNERVLKLAAGANTQTELPFTGLTGYSTVTAVDAVGNVYVGDYYEQPNASRVLKLPPGAGTATEMLTDASSMLGGMAVDTAGNVYVSDDSNRVLKLAAGSSTTTEVPFTGLSKPQGVAVDKDGNVYVVDAGNNRVVKLTAGSSTQTVLPFTGLKYSVSQFARQPSVGVAVDNTEAVYVTDGNDRVLKLAAGASVPTVLPFTGLSGPMGVAVDGAGTVYVADTGNNRVVKLPPQ